MGSYDYDLVRFDVFGLCCCLIHLFRFFLISLNSFTDASHTAIPQAGYNSPKGSSIKHVVIYGKRGGLFKEHDSYKILLWMDKIPQKEKLLNRAYSEMSFVTYDTYRPLVRLTLQNHYEYKNLHSYDHMNHNAMFNYSL